MSPTRSLLAAGGLTALVVVAVLMVGARQGAFGLGAEPEAALLPVDGAGLAQDTISAADPVQRSHQDDDDEDGEDDDDDEDEDDDRSTRLGRTERRSGGDTAGRVRHDDD
jgi:hypothetical protein